MSPSLTTRGDVLDVETWPLDEGNLEIASAWLSEERNAQWLDFGGAADALSPAVLKMMVARDRHCIWVFGPPGEGRAIGLVALSNIQHRFQTAEAWCVLGEKAYGSRDLTIRAVSRLLQHGFQELALYCVYAWTVEVNRGGRRILQRMGFRPAGRLRSSHVIRGRRYDRLWFDLLRDEYDGYEETWR